MNNSKILIFLILVTVSLNRIVLGQVNFTSSNLPIVIIDTHGQTIPNEPKITADMGIIYNGQGIRNNVTDPLNNYHGKIGIEIRGSSSQMYPKKQYAVETRDSLGNNLNISLLGLPSENDWILYAPYSDKSLMRNVLTYRLANELGWYASRTRWCEVVINGDYKGIYVLMEKIKRDKNRVNIKKLNPSSISGDDLTGGYILKIDKNDGSNNAGWNSPFPPYPGAWQQIYYQYHYPKPSDIVPEQEIYIQNFINHFETILDGNDYTHPFLGYYDLINIESFVDYFIINEIGKNVDGYRLSAFMYKNRDSENPLLVMGPAWDFNLAFGNCDFYNCWINTGWQIQGQIPNFDNWQIPFWWPTIFQDPIFKNKISRRWHTLRNNLFDVNSLMSYIDSTALEIDEAMNRNYVRWPILGTYVWPNFYIGQTYADDLNYLKIWLQARITWIDASLPTNYSVLNWTDPSSISFSGIPNITKSIPINSLVSVGQNVDSVSFVANDPGLQISYDSDSLWLTANSTSEYLFKGLAWNSRDKTDISPGYTYSTINTSINSENDLVNKQFQLFQNFPNPFNPFTTISFYLPQNAYVRLEIYTLVGQIIHTLESDYLNQGEHKYTWNASDFPSGIFILNLQTGSFKKSIKMIYLK